MEMGKWIIVEGLDGSGKSTAIEILKHYYEKYGKNVAVVRAIGSGELGIMLRKLLIEEEYTNSDINTLAFPVAIMDAIGEVFEALYTHDVVIMDRYLGSYFAYENEDNDNLVQFIIQHIVNYQNSLIGEDEKPLNIFIDAPIDQCISRIESRGNKQFSDLYSKEKFNDILWRFELYYKQHNIIIVKNDSDLPTFEQVLLNSIL